MLDDSRKWWKARNRRGVAAHVPHTIVAPASSPPASPHLYPNPIYTHYQVLSHSVCARQSVAAPKCDHFVIAYSK